MDKSHQPTWIWLIIGGIIISQLQSVWLSTGLIMVAKYRDAKSFLRNFSPKGLHCDVFFRGRRTLLYNHRSEWGKRTCGTVLLGEEEARKFNKIKHTHSPKSTGRTVARKKDEKNHSSYKNQHGAEFEGYNEESYCCDMGGFLFSLSRWQRQPSFECHRTAFQLTQKSRRLHLFLKLDAIISVNHAAAKHRNLHYNTLSCPAP